MDNTISKSSRHNSFGWNIAVLASDMSDSLDRALRPLGLTISQWPTLFALWEEDGLTQSELTNRCNTAHYTTTRLLDSLEKLALVERRIHPSSRRTHQVYLTSKGKALKRKALKVAHQVNDAFFAGLTPHERKQLESLILKMVVSRHPELIRDNGN